jgi:hypothetical protein
MVTFSINGVRHFNGDGTGVVKARLLSIRHPRALPATATRPDPLFERGSVAETEMTADFTYAVGADGGLTIANPTVPNVFLLPEQPGGNAPRPDTVLVTGVAPFVGAVSADHKTLEVTQEPGVEKHVAQRWNGTEFVEQVDFRVCHRSRVLLRLKD